MADDRPGARPSARLPIRVRVLLPLMLLLLGYVSMQLYGRAPGREVVELAGAAMGTTWSVKLAAPDVDGTLQRRASEAISQRLARVDALMSTWREDSELSLFNASSSLAPMRIAPETGAVIAIAQDVARASDGALDVTVGPLVDAWGFGPGQRRAPPDDLELARLREAVGWRKLVLSDDRRSLAKAHPGVRVDLSAVAKGFGVDEIARGLEALELRDFLVEVGGELRARGTRGDGGPWRVAIETPDAPGRRIHRIVALGDLAMATSGDYRNYYEIDGHRVSHTIDPRSGRPIDHALASVTVLHELAAVADAWATALNVLGPEEGYALAEARSLAAYFLVRSEQGFEGRATSDFEPYWAKEQR